MDRDRDTVELWGVIYTLKSWTEWVDQLNAFWPDRDELARALALERANPRRIGDQIEGIAGLFHEAPPLSVLRALPEDDPQRLVDCVKVRWQQKSRMGIPQNDVEWAAVTAELLAGFEGQYAG